MGPRLLLVYTGLPQNPWEGSSSQLAQEARLVWVGQLCFHPQRGAFLRLQLSWPRTLLAWLQLRLFIFQINLAQEMTQLVHASEKLGLPSACYWQSIELWAALYAHEQGSHPFIFFQSRNQCSSCETSWIPPSLIIVALAVHFAPV